MPPAFARDPPDRLEDLNGKVKDELARIDRFADRLVKAKLATPTSRSGTPAGRHQRNRRGQQIIAAAKAEGKEPDRSKLNVELLMEAQALMNIQTWAVIAGDGPRGTGPRHHA